MTRPYKIRFSVTSPGLLRSIPVVTSIEEDIAHPSQYGNKSRNWYLRHTGRMEPVKYCESLDKALEEAGL